MDQTKILDVKINKITTKEVLEKIKSFLLSDRQHYIVTLNPEMIVKAQKNNHFKKIINEADIVVPDGIGILWGSDFLKHITPPDKGGWRVGKNIEKLRVFTFTLYKFIFSLLKLLFYKKHRKEILKYRTHGIDLIYKICGSEFIKDKKIYLLGAGEGIAGKTAKVLSEKYDYLNVVGAEEGIPAEISNFQFPISNKFPISNFKILRQAIKRIGKVCGYRKKILNPPAGGQNDSRVHISCNNLIQRINKTQPDIIFIAFGAPKQEEWICENLKKMPSVKLAIGVGGSFDFVSGKVKRAPLILQKLGLEWLWRLILEPRRIKRIYNATVKFCWLVLRK